MAITVPPVRGAGDLGHVDDSNTVREALLDLDTAATSAQGAADAALSAVGDHTHPGEGPPALPIAGGTMTGQLLLPNGEPAAPSLAHAGDTDTGVFFPAADTVAIATGATERVRIDSAGLITGSGTSLGAWTAYTPTLGGTGWAIGDGSAYGRYTRLGKVVMVVGQVIFGGSSTYGSGSPTVSVPVTGAGVIDPSHVASTVFTDVSTGKRYRAAPFMASTTTVQIDVHGTNGEQTGTTSTSPFTWASGDKINFGIVYEAA